ncbi:hypothetical protein [Microtetraspora malaysiensis]|uniref:hypothetical protein n=1 Tax=Microtetraspora malaysiensis TaxID=161358 RepID=UPI003D904649
MPVGVIGSGTALAGRTRTDRAGAAGTRLGGGLTVGAVTGGLVGMLPLMAGALMARALPPTTEMLVQAALAVIAG